VLDGRGTGRTVVGIAEQRFLEIERRAGRSSPSRS